MFPSYLSKLPLRRFVISRQRKVQLMRRVEVVMGRAFVFGARGQQGAYLLLLHLFVAGRRRLASGSRGC